MAAVAILAIACAAQSTELIWSVLNVPRLSAKLLMLVPKVGRLAPKEAISLSPTILASQPPVFGIASAAVAIFLMALAAAVTELIWSSPNVPRLAANDAMFAPRPGSCEPNDARDDSPPPKSLPRPSMTLAAERIITVSARALTPPSISALSMDAPATNGIAFIMNLDRSVPNSAKPSPRFTIEAIPAIKSATAKAAIAPAKYPVPSSTLESTFLTPSINGVTLVMNSDRFLPISGNPELIPDMAPPTMLPTKLPRAYPIRPSVSPPSAINSLNPGICASAPAAATTMAIMPINAARPNAPSIAAAEGIILTIAHAAAIASSSTDRDSADVIVDSIGISCIL